MGVEKRRMSISGEIENVRVACDFVVDFVNDINLDEDVAFQSQLSVEEVCTNIVEHGYAHNGADKTIEIICVYEKNLLRIRIIDEAPLFNPLNRNDPDPNMPLLDRKEGGWGVYFVKQYMTSVVYEVVGGQNSLVLTKEIP